MTSIEQTPRQVLIKELRRALNQMETSNSNPYFDIDGYGFAYDADWLDSPDLRANKCSNASERYKFREGDIVEDIGESFSGSEVVRTIILVNGSPYVRFMAGDGCDASKLRRVSK